MTAGGATGSRLVGILGGGTMGAGVAHAFLGAGTAVVVVETDPDRARAARDSVAASLRRAVERGYLQDADAALSRLVVTTAHEPLRDAGLVIEAVPEDPGLKVALLGAVEPVLNEDAVLGTNTSSLSVDDLAAGLARPERFVGMHFFNPVPASQLVELVRGAATAPATLARARGWAELIGKETIEVRDSPGFASSRLGVAIGLEAIRMLEEGVASAADLDAAMVLGYRFPMGPLRLTDRVGLDVRLAIAEYLHATLGERFAPPRLLRHKVELGELGQKTGKGFFDW